MLVLVFLPIIQQEELMGWWDGMIPVELHDLEFELLGHWFKLKFLIEGKEI